MHPKASQANLSEPARRRTSTLTPPETIPQPALKLTLHSPPTPPMPGDAVGVYGTCGTLHPLAFPFSTCHPFLLYKAHSWTKMWGLAGSSACAFSPHTPRLRIARTPASLRSWRCPRQRLASISMGTDATQSIHRWPIYQRILVLEWEPFS